MANVSASARNGTRHRTANSAVAAAAPMSRPWVAIPPSQNAGTNCGCAL